MRIMCGMLVGVESIQRSTPWLRATSSITMRRKSLPCLHPAITLASRSAASQPETWNALLLSHSRIIFFLFPGTLRLPKMGAQHIEHVHLCVEFGKASRRKQKVIEIARVPERGHPT